MPANNIVWTPQMAERLLQLIGKGISYHECARIISREFGVRLTKNACVGKGRRLQVPLRMPTRKGRACQKRKKQSLKTRSLPQSERRKRARASLQRQIRRGHTRRRQSPRRPPRQPQLLTLLQLKTRSCRWPTGDRAPYLFCGEVQAEGSSYCLKHALIASPHYGRER